jgi:GH25 family lysozyme M1 (1,4-beta-N-acetylmuramidase)
VFYSYPYYIVGLRASEPIGYGLWLADYGANTGTPHEPHVPAPWRRCVLHQFTSNGLIDGVSGRCDLNRAPRMRPLYAFPTRATLLAPLALVRRIAG